MAVTKIVENAHPLRRPGSPACFILREREPHTLAMSFHVKAYFRKAYKIPERAAAGMCGRFGLFDGIDDLAWHFNVSPEDLDGYAPRWNIAPTMPILTVGRDRVVIVVRWGIRGSRDGRPLFNARSETVHWLPAFRDAFRRGRCLIPASGFYEWRQQSSGGKAPVWAHRVDGKPIAFAGVIDDDGRSEPSAAIITTEPNSLLAPVHHRMPVVLEPEAWRQWLHDDSRSTDLRALMLPREWPNLALRYVSHAVNRTGNDGPHLVVAIDAGIFPLL